MKIAVDISREESAPLADMREWMDLGAKLRARNPTAFARLSARLVELAATDAAWPVFEQALADFTATTRAL